MKTYRSTNNISIFHNIIATSVKMRTNMLSLRLKEKDTLFVEQVTSPSG